MTCWGSGTTVVRAWLYDRLQLPGGGSQALSSSRTPRGDDGRTAWILPQLVVYNPAPDYGSKRLDIFDLVLRARGVVFG